ncbi:type IV toxin-antitoxin system AbiEi family antitoxin domain-containing protein [Salinibacterium sp. M195]|uniref:type IV toxin-antitoxin system AbiEi family antitoxin domain-containing protein n=1 Tax=Salinibacterium sp. M195 TaxID=2583374 RepID=UPI001C63332B|nr:type IV toxin-antitoxin system AbiEi family antitoxin domain-containing protein [Salinibacterium sp. M195]
MADVRELVDELDGLAQKRQLVARGASDYDLTHAVRRGEVVRARQGWYTTADPSEPRVRAVRVGGRLTGISAIVDWGGWVLGEHPLHVSVAHNAARLRSQWNRRHPLGVHRGVELHWAPILVSDQGSNWHVSVLEALRRVIVDHDLETAVAAVDWALHTRRVDEFDFELLILSLPSHKRAIRSWVDRHCESLPESLARTRLRLRGHRVEIQVPVGGKRIDLVVNGVVGLEINGKQFHAHTFEEDHLKGLEITIAGFHAMSLSARMVFAQWELFLRALESALASHPLDDLGNSGDSACELAAGPRIRTPASQSFGIS